MPTPRVTETHDRRYRRRARWALLASVLFHILVLLFFRQARPLPPSPFAAAGPRAGDDRAAPGGGMQVIAYRVVQPTPPPVVVEPQPVPRPVPETPVPEIEEPQPQVAAVERPAIDVAAAIGRGRGDRSGEGLPGGTGRGDGGTDEEGRFRVVPPSPRGLILPPSDRPGKVRGREIDVWVFVTAAGQVVADSTRLEPATGDRRFDDRLRKQAAEWVFTPARRGGQAVAEWFRYTLIL